MTAEAILSLDVPNIKHLRTGKVRELYGIEANDTRSSCTWYSF
ncbi:hypothetical protein ACFL3D_01050 [Candidatus Omnitrophota bacterium]